jgi:hypothetical protein
MVERDEKKREELVVSLIVMVSVSVCTMRPVVNVWALTWVIRYWNIQCLNHAILLNNNTTNIVFTDGRQQRQPNHNTTTYCVYWRITTTINPVITRPHILFTYVVVLWLGLLLLSSDSKHNMWSYYDWIYCCFSPSVNRICGRVMTTDG